MFVNTLSSYKDGATLTLDGLESVDFDSGCAVSITDTVVDFKDDAISKVIKDYKAAAKWLNKEAFLGVWINKGKCYLDLSVIVDDKNRALEMASEFNQKAIFDFVSKDVIDV